MKIMIRRGGFVRLVDSMGSDAAIVQAARVSYGDGTKTKSDDETLLRFMMRHGHTSPFEMCTIKIHERIPMDTWRQMVRHRTASVNEYSTRYSVAIDEVADIAADEWREQSTTNRQGSGDYIDPAIGAELTERQSKLTKLQREEYEYQLSKGVAREQARCHLPLNTYTEVYWQINLHNLFHFLYKRLMPDAQLEIREYANAIASIAKHLYPLAYAAFEDYKLNAVTLSALEMECIREGWDRHPRMSNREAKEFQEKMSCLKK